ncbi:DNA methyltransferase [Polymorphospora sp. NPDC051019]|uniref:Eco57I restriction-modification methylase domain-containing protein n=1 Tax=Polymorphospora sp. NPDC051019 TaxID=3155725 RepID=UPI003412CAD8
MNRRPSRRPATPDGATQHREWLSLVDISGPFLSLPVLRDTWPGLDALDRPARHRLRLAHATWLDDRAAGQSAWTDHVLRDLLGWRELLRDTGLDRLAVDVAEHDTTIRPSFVLVEPGPAATADTVKPDDVRLLGLVCPPGHQPTARVPGSAWAATYADRLAHLCRHHDVELGLATDGRFWTLVWAPRGKATTTAVFDAIAWPETAERVVVRAFVSLLSRHRFFNVAEPQRLVKLLHASLENQEELTEALGVQVRQAVELLVAAIGRADVHDREHGGPGLRDVDAHDVYRGAVSVMMRIVFLLFAEERNLLPADNPLYARAYSAGGLRAELQQQADDGTEDELEHSYAGWQRLLALFHAIYRGVDHSQLTMPAHDGSLFDPAQTDWLPLTIDDRTVLHMLNAVQRVQVGTGKNREVRTLSFATLDVEQIGYVYEGLLSFEGFRADEVTVGLIGKEGIEEEMPLSVLEELRTRHGAELPKALAEKYKDSKIGSAAALAKKLTPPDDVEREEVRKRLLAVTGGDYPLAERLMPFDGVIRKDLRGLPVVILPGALFVTESALRGNTGTHYTPRELAEEVVEHALEPLVYAPGPLQTADRTQWTPKSAREILALKVADIAMGSAAFLVAAGRYLAGHLIAAWAREGDERAISYVVADGDRPVNADADPLVIEARRQIIEHCLYGVDINPMAVEMAKLSLWLVSMDPHRPFTFLDDRLVAGDSLLGITNLDQLETMHLDPVKGRKLHEGTFFDWTSGVRELVAEVARDRRRIAEVESADGSLDAKRELLAAAEAKTARLRLYADLAVGAALANAGRGERAINAGSVEAAKLVDDVAAGRMSEEDARVRATRWLATDHVPGSFDRHPLHWPLTFPEVFNDRNGFDGVIGNPPFLGGQKLTGTLGTAHREYLVETIGRGVRGSADLVAYFVLRAHAVLNNRGQTGLIATNTLAQGDTREVGLDQIAAAGTTIRRAIKSRPWPSRSAVLEYCAAWTSRAPVAKQAERVLDDAPVRDISPALDSVSRTSGNPFRLAASGGRSFIGSYVLGMGFTMDPADAIALIEKDSANKDVLFPYLNGQDLNSSPDAAASRWVINFHDWSEARAQEYADCYGQVVRLVKPERSTNNDKRRREIWWRFTRPAPELYQAIAGLGRVVVIARVSKTVMPVMVPTGQVISEAVVVFATDDTAMLGLLSSAPHYWWAVSRASTLETRVRYTPSDVFETLALPELTAELRELGDRLDTYRRDLMLARQAGLTATYNLVHNPSCQDDDIAELRRIHVAIDEAVCRAYGWDDLLAHGLDHDFHDLGRETRYTVGAYARREMVDLLLELNHERYAAEVAAGLHDRKKSARKAAQPEGTLF